MRDNNIQRITPPGWEEVYSQANLAYIPWNSDRPDLEFVQLIESGEINFSHALDIGCGTGTDAVFLASRGATMTAIDISLQAIRLAEEKAGKAGVMVNFITGDFLGYDFGNEKFDFVNDRGCFHIMKPVDRDAFALKVSAVLKGAGRYYLKCWSDKNEFVSEMTPYRISKDIIHRTFSSFFEIGEITDGRWGGRGPWAYTCLMRKK